MVPPLPACPVFVPNKNGSSRSERSHLFASSLTIYRLSESHITNSYAGLDSDLKNEDLGVTLTPKDFEDNNELFTELL